MNSSKTALKWMLCFALGLAPLNATWAEESPQNAGSEPKAGGADVTIDRPTAAPRDEAPSEALPESLGGMGSALARTALMLAFVVVLIYITLNLGLRKLMGIRGAPAGHAPMVQVLERVALSQRHTLFVVKVADDLFLLGSGESGVSLVSRLNAETMTSQPDGEGAGATDAADSPFLRKLLSKRDRP